MATPEIEEEAAEAPAGEPEGRAPATRETAFADRLHGVLQELQSRLAGILGSALVDDDGFPLAWDLKGGADPHLTATAGGLLTRATKRTLRVLDFGTMRNTILTTTKGSIAVFRVTRDLSLILLLQPSTNNILVLIEANRAIERIKQVMRSAYE